MPCPPFPDHPFCRGAFEGTAQSALPECLHSYLNACIQVAHIGRIVCAGGVLGALIKAPYRVPCPGATPHSFCFCSRLRRLSGVFSFCLYEDSLYFVAKRVFSRSRQGEYPFRTQVKFPRCGHLTKMTPINDYRGKIPKT